MADRLFAVAYRVLCDIGRPEEAAQQMLVTCRAPTIDRAIEPGLDDASRAANIAGRPVFDEIEGSFYR